PPTSTNIYTPSLHDALPIFTLPALHLPSPHFLLLDAMGFCCYSRQTSALAYSACCSAKLLSTLLTASRLLPALLCPLLVPFRLLDRKSTRLNSSHDSISYAV